MPPVPPTARMGELHEIHLAEINGGRKSTSSGNQWDDPNDGRNHHDDSFAFSWDGKSTKGKSISVSLEMLAKIREQAGPERPELGLRWYGDEMLSSVLEDWIAIPDVDFEEMKIAATAYEAARPQIDAALADLDQLRSENDRLTEGLRAALETVQSLREAASRAVADQERVIPGYIPRLPWVTVHMMTRPEALPGWTGPSSSPEPQYKTFRFGVRYDADGAQQMFDVGTVRVERSMGNRPRLFVNDVIVRDGDLYRDGVMQVRVCESDRSITETG
jgi:hypothetical protein